MLDNKPFGLLPLIRAFRWKVAVTWLLVIVENSLMALIPLSIGVAIDGLIGGTTRELVWPTGLLVGLTLIAMARRAYDTRVYGTMRVHLGSEIAKRLSDRPVSALSARLEMGRELVDFLEEQLPESFTAVIQLLVSLVIFFSFDWRLGASALGVLALMIGIYALFQSRFLLGNQRFNEQMELQVAILSAGRPGALRRHLRRLRHWEVRLSDTEAIVYGLIFLLMSAFIIHNLVLAVDVVGGAAGKIFAIVSYSWEFVEAAIMLPATLQMLTRLQDITRRLNGEDLVEGHVELKEGASDRAEKYSFARRGI